MNGRHAQAGFTLAELLGGLAIAAILVLPLADLLRTGADSARSVRTALDLNGDARFALDRIGMQVAALSSKKVFPVGASVPPAAWLAPVSYALSGTDLVETDPTVPTGTSTIAANVTALRLTTPEVVDGRPLVGIELTLSAGGNSVTRTRTVRVGKLPSEDPQ
ncbi:prepilin-type N-terminal cleavage/methylation domain-containing protein [Pseudoduganella sp. SL102]|uniref:PilW family protein n=1 Tax=Pseudoduganella sp. SL102 TaxID=2995154 RepID=UPI00248C2415|nr:prepilin-type N-terminal cleavage/methylation domain-containing protein [Pseudoduganella sp. SL102]WBS01068.1 prepilin-type N-terminal cleavage/methylation domain-containing protein [Pseudoduganella sp. SL102]